MKNVAYPWLLLVQREQQIIAMKYAMNPSDADHFGAEYVKTHKMKPYDRLLIVEIRKAIDL